MKKTKTLICVLVLALMCVALFGCSKKITDNSKTQDKQTEQRKPDEQKNQKKPEEEDTVTTPKIIKPVTNEEIEYYFEIERIGKQYGIRKYIGEETSIELPSKYRGREITQIGYYAFRGDKVIEKVVVPSNIKIVGDGSFMDCSNLRTVELKEGLKEIRSSAFLRSNIECITIPSSVEEIGWGAFQGCENLKTVRLNEVLKSISEQVFSGSGIESITIPSNVEKIDGYAFRLCKNLKSVTLNEGLKSIGSGTFVGTSIEEITIPSTVDYIGSTFGDAKIKVGDGNSKYEAIDNCLIEKTTKTLISGGKYSAITNGVKEIGGEAFSGTSIESITIPSTVKKIGRDAFRDCKNLKTVTLNEGLKEIEYSVFVDTQIERITIPSTVEKIGSYAFYNCNNLSRIDCKVKKEIALSYSIWGSASFEGLLEKESIINWLNG